MKQELRPLWQLLVLARKPDIPVQLTCEECFALLEYDADLLAADAFSDQIRPSIMHHLALCSGCQTKFEDWLASLDRDALASIGS